MMGVTGMRAIKIVDLVRNCKEICESVVGGEPVIVSRPHNKNVVVISEVEFNELTRARQMERLRESTAHQQKVSAVRSFLSAAAAHESELTDADWSEMAKLRSGTNAGFTSRAVEL